MWRQCLVVIIAAMVFLGVTSAQEYNIRLTYNTNLRDSNSLQANIVETAPAGSTLQVAGESARWLRINRNWRTVWMASWVSHTRVEASPRTESQGQSTPPVDNCCFVDRQCENDEDWVSGYWAFQNNQCPAPAQSQTQPSQQPVPQTTAQVDNCCSVDRQCHNDAEWTAGYWAYQNGQCGAPSQPATAGIPASAWLASERTLIRPIIVGSEWFVYGINSSLDLMQRSAPEWYNYVLNAADRIVEAFNPATPDHPHANTTNWGDGRNRTIGIGAGSLSCYVGRLCRVSVAGILGHEACHIHEHLAGIVYGPDDPHWHDLCQKAARDTSASIRAGYSRSAM